MANKESKNFVETMVDAQKQVVDTMVENSKKLANGNKAVKESVEKGSEWYKNWLDSQNTIFTSATQKAGNATTEGKENLDKMNEFYQNWFNTQMGWAKQMWEMNMNHMKEATEKATAPKDPMTMWTNNWNNWMNSVNQTNQWNEMMKNWTNANPFNTDNYKKATENWTGLFNQYYEMLNNSFSDMQKNLENGTTQDAYRNLVNVSEAFTRFSEMWMPFWKSIQEKTFNADMFKQMADPSMYKDMMDKYFGFMPEQSREYVQNMQNMMQEQMSKNGQMAMNNYQQMRGMMNNMMPGQTDMFSNMLNGYNTFYNMMNDAAAPFTKMMTPNQHTKTMMEWKDIANRMAIYNIKNAELQYMVYNQGAKVMENLADNIAKKVEEGTEINNLMSLYQEWLNLGDSTFVELFESEEYSKAMAEVNAMQLTLRKDVEKQLEKYMVGMPVATRSEMDELYKTIYDLKKQVRELEKAAKEKTAETKATTTATKSAGTTATKKATSSRSSK